MTDIKRADVEETLARFRVAVERLHAGLAAAKTLDAETADDVETIHVLWDSYYSVAIATLEGILGEPADVPGPRLFRDLGLPH